MSAQKPRAMGTEDMSVSGTSTHIQLAHGQLRKESVVLIGFGSHHGSVIVRSGCYTVQSGNVAAICSRHPSPQLRCLFHIDVPHALIPLYSKPDETTPDL